MTQLYPKRLIEVDLPIFRISAHARREKSIRHGHISTLHIWWARRPLAACRAVICAALWPDPGDPLCPMAFREAAVRILTGFAKRVFPDRITKESSQLKDTAKESLGRWEALAAGTLTLNPRSKVDMPILRLCLLDFIADFANWDNSTAPAYLEAARRLTGVAHASLSDPEYRLPLECGDLSPLSPAAEPLSSASTSGKKAHRRTAADDQNKSGSAADQSGEESPHSKWLSTLDSQLSTLPRPLVVDPFCGGGSIPLEALRVGADAFAGDLNPVPVLLNKVVLEYIPKYGQRLAEEVRKWGAGIKREADKELAEFYPKDPDGATPIAYLWARTIRCEGPACGAEVPLIRSLWLAKKANRSVALRLIPNPQEKRVDFQIIVKQHDGWANQADVGSAPVGGKALAAGPKVEAHSESPAASALLLTKNPSFDGTVKRGSATCPCCGYTTPVARVREQFKARRGGTNDARLFCVVTTHDDEQGRFYRLPTKMDSSAFLAATNELQRRLNDPATSHANALPILPDEPLPPPGGLGFRVQPYGMTIWSDLFSRRQLLAQTTLLRLVRLAGDNCRQEMNESGISDAVQACLSCAVGRQADHGNSLCAWNPSGPKVQHLFGRQAIPMFWDYAEAMPFGDSVGDWGHAIECVLIALNNANFGGEVGCVEQASATRHQLPNDTVSAFFTDPPYYDAVPYSDLSDFFYVWLKRTLPTSLLGPFRDSLTPKLDECIVDTANGKDHEFFESTMTKAMAEGRRVTKPDGVGLVVFAHKSTSGWEAQLKGIIDAGWIVTGSWPIDTEMGTRLRAMDSAALASSVHLVCRPREDASGAVTESVGEWRDVLGELPKRIHEWMPRLAAEGVVGADAIFACLGPALEIFSRYSRVEKASGEAVPLREYLEQVWAAVSTEALSLIFKDADAAGLEPDARLTAMWLWTLGGMASNGNAKPDANADGEQVVASTGYTLEYDAARKIAQGLGIHLKQSESIVEVTGDKARLLPCSERTRHLFGKDDTVSSSGRGRKKKKAKQQSLFEEFDELAAEAETVAGELKPQAGETVLDRVHQSMILFAAGRGEALRRFLVEDGAGTDARFWKLAQSLSALYPKETDEKRWVDGVLARKKGLGL